MILARTMSLFTRHTSAFWFLLYISIRTACSQGITAAPDGNPYNIPPEYITLSGISEVAIPAEAIFRGWEPSLSSFCSTTQLKSYAEHLLKYSTINDLWLGRVQKPPCCGPCRIGAHEAQLVYWPDRFEDGATAVVKDMTFTYPQNGVILSAVTAADGCGLLGTSLSHAALPILGDFSTVINRVVYDSRPNQVPTRTGPISVTIDFEDLKNCGNSTGYNPTTITSYGPEGQTTVMWSDRCSPSIVIPDNVYTIQPKWSTCSGWLVDGVPDPPIALKPVSGPLKPIADPTPTSDRPAPSPTAEAADLPTPPAPQTFSQPEPSPTRVDPVKSPEQPELPEPAKTSKTSSSPNQPNTPSQPSKNDSTPPKDTSAFLNDNDPLPPKDLPTLPSNNNSMNHEPTAGKVLGQPAAVLPSSAGIQLGTQTLHAGVAAVTISGTPVSAARNGVLVIGSSSTTLGEVAPSPNPTGILIGGQLLTPGSTPVTVSGTVISLGSSVLVVGSSTTTFMPTATIASGGTVTSAEMGAAILSALGWEVTPAGESAIPMPTPTTSVGDQMVIMTGTAVMMTASWKEMAKAWVIGVVGWWLWA